MAQSTPSTYSRLRHWVRTRYIRYFADDFESEELEFGFQDDLDRRDILSAWDDLKLFSSTCGLTAACNLIVYCNFWWNTPYNNISPGWNFQPIAGLVESSAWLLLIALTLLVGYLTVERVVRVRGPECLRDRALFDRMIRIINALKNLNMGGNALMYCCINCPQHSLINRYIERGNEYDILSRGSAFNVLYDQQKIKPAAEL